MWLLFAAPYPERVVGLILLGSYAQAVGASVTQDDIAATERAVRETWGSGSSIAGFAPSLTGDASFRDWWAKRERLSASPSVVINLLRMNREIDVRSVLPSIRAPTLVIHRRDDVRVRLAAAHLLAESIPNAVLVELPGRDHLSWTADQGAITDALAKFVGASPESVDIDRVLSTVLFTDIVDSTPRADAAGDRQWPATPETHHPILGPRLQR